MAMRIDYWHNLVMLLTRDASMVPEPQLTVAISAHDDSSSRKILHERVDLRSDNRIRSIST